MWCVSDVKVQRRSYLEMISKEAAILFCQNNPGYEFWFKCF